jgi:cardiolipin synthase
VRVRIILPSRTDSWLVFNAGRSFYDEMLEAGIQVFERRDRLLHSKTASVDGVWATVGSTNLDWRSLVFNDELNAVVLGPEFAAQLDAAFEQDIAHSQAITLEQWEHRPLADRMREVVARAWAHML